MEQHDYEKRTSIGFPLARIAKRLGDGLDIIHITNPDPATQ